MTKDERDLAGLTDQMQVIYVSKVGSDSDDGLNIEVPKLTIAAAITAASAMTPTSSNQVTVDIIDSGNYTESFSLPEWVHINGLNADIDVTIDLDDNCIIRIRRLANTGVGECISKLNGPVLSQVMAVIMFVSAVGNTVIAF